MDPMDASGAAPRWGELSIQERLYPHLTCFGCGHANPKGLHLRSYPGDGEVTATFRPWPEHDNGFGFLNGGIIATVLDCHSGAAVFDESARRGDAESFPLAAAWRIRQTRQRSGTPPRRLRRRHCVSSFHDGGLTHSWFGDVDDEFRSVAEREPFAGVLGQLRVGQRKRKSTGLRGDAG